MSNIWSLNLPQIDIVGGLEEAGMTFQNFPPNLWTEKCQAPTNVYKCMKTHFLIKKLQDEFIEIIFFLKVPKLYKCS